MGRSDAELVEHEPRVFEDVAVRVAPELVAAGAGLALAAAVALPGVAGMVVAVAVELDGETQFGPAAIDAPGTGDPVGPRQHKPVLAHEREEAPLERAERDVHVAVQDPAQLLGAGAGRTAARTASTCAGVVP